MTKYTPSATQPVPSSVVQDQNNRGLRYDVDRVARREVEFTVAPTVINDERDGYDIGATWVDTTTNLVYICVDNAVGAAIWQLVNTGSVNTNFTFPVMLGGDEKEDNLPLFPSPFMSPLTTKGDIYTRSSLDTRLGVGTNFFQIYADSNETTGLRWMNPSIFRQQGLHNMAFAQGADSSQLKITSAQNSALSATNPGAVVMRSSTNGSYRLFAVTADVTLDLTGCHWGLDTKGNITGAILHVYAIDDNGTLRWGVGYQGGFNYIRNTQDDTTAANINLPEEIFASSAVGTDNSPMLDVGWIKANFTDASNEWAITEYHPNEYADGVWQPWTTTFGGFSVVPSITTSTWMQQGQTVYVTQSTANGTSNATTFTVTGPVKAKRAEAGVGNGYLVNNGATLVAAQAGAVTSTAASSVTLDLRRDPLGTAWTNANGKRGNITMFYEAYQP